MKKRLSALLLAVCLLWPHGAARSLEPVPGDWDSMNYYAFPVSPASPVPAAAGGSRVLEVGETAELTASQGVPTYPPAGGVTYIYSWEVNSISTDYAASEVLRLSGTGQSRRVEALGPGRVTVSAKVSMRYETYDAYLEKYMPKFEEASAGSWTVDVTRPYMVTFDTQGRGSASPKSKIVFAGLTYGQLPEPYSAGYAFEGWYTQPEGGGKVTAETAMTRREDHTLFAHWSRTAPVGTNACGEDVFWSFEAKTGTLTISGTGKMYDYPADEPPEYVKEHGNAIRKAVVTKGVASVGANAFRGCAGLVKLTLEEGVEALGDYAFRGCGGLKCVVFPRGLTSFGDGAFMDCAGLERIILPEDLGVLWPFFGGGIFENCRSLKSVAWPKSLWMVVKPTFGMSPQMDGHTVHIYYEGTEAEWRKNQKNFEIQMQGGRLVYHYGTRGPFSVSLSEVDPLEADLCDPEGLLDEAQVFAASYNEEGRMTALRRGTVTQDTIRFQRPLREGDVLFFLDSQGRPLMEKALL